MFQPLPVGNQSISKKLDIPFKFNTKSSVLKAIYNFYIYLHNQVLAINNSKYFVGIIIIIMNIAGKFVTFRMSKTVESYLKFSFSRNVLVFAMIWMGTRDIYIAALMSIIFVVIVDYLFNEDSMFCCLPENFTDGQINKLEEMGKELTPDDIETMQRILEKLQKGGKENMENKENKDKENKDKDNKDKENKDKENKDKENKEKENKENKDNESKDKESKDKDKQDKDKQAKESEKNENNDSKKKGPEPFVNSRSGAIAGY